MRRSRPLNSLKSTDQPVIGEGHRHLAHLLTPEELSQRGMDDRRALLAVEHYPESDLHNEGLEERHFSVPSAVYYCVLGQVAQVDPLMFIPLRANSPPPPVPGRQHALRRPKVDHDPHIRTLTCRSFSWIYPLNFLYRSPIRD